MSSNKLSACTFDFVTKRVYSDLAVVVLSGVQGMIGDPKGEPKSGTSKFVLDDLKETYDVVTRSLSTKTF